jgi:hypothetical protein
LRVELDQRIGMVQGGDRLWATGRGPKTLRESLLAQIDCIRGRLATVSPLIWQA